MKLILVIMTGLFLSSCGGWYGNQEEGYMMACEENMVKRIPSGDKKMAKAICACSLEKVKEKWSYDEFTQESGSAEADKIMTDCIESELGEE